MLTLQAAQKEFEPTGVYANTATIGLPPRRRSRPSTRRSRRGGQAAPRPRATTSWSSARAGDSPAGGVTPDRVAIGNQVSTFTGLVAAALPDGARVLAAEEDFTSVLFPFLAHADRGVRVETVPLDRLVEAIRPGVDLVAVSAVQSADGRIVPGGLDALARPPPRHGCLTYVDATQAVGWLPLDAGRFDVVSARRTSGRSRLAARRSGWSGRASPDAAPAQRRLVRRRRSVDLDLRTAAAPGPGRAPARHLAGVAGLGGDGAALDLLAEVGIAAIHRHDVGLANALRARLGLPAAIRPSSR